MMDFAGRREKLRKLLKKTGAEALLISSESNVTYLTGFTGDSSFLLLTQDKELLISDGRYDTQIKAECPGLEMDIRRAGVLIHEQTIKILRAAKIARLAIEAESMSVATRDRLAEGLPKMEIGHSTGMVEFLRQCKDKEELKLIREAIRIAETSFAAIRASLQPDQTEAQVGDALERQIRALGGDGPAFATIVAAGPRAALPHAGVSGGCVGEGELVLIDWGAQWHLYKSDLTRVLVTGRISPKLRRVYEVVFRAQARAIAAIRPEVETTEVDEAARSVIAAAGLGRRFNHGIGHGFGLQIHEAPKMSSKNSVKLRPGMVVTVEPGVYLPGWGGIRIEDDVLVTRNGHEILTSAPKQLEEMVI
jgi:Xaa-Pro aminopeptidase